MGGDVFRRWRYGSHAGRLQCTANVLGDCANEGEEVLDHCAFCSEVSTAFKFESSTRVVFAGETEMATSHWRRRSPANAGVSRFEIQYCPVGTLSKEA